MKNNKIDQIKDSNITLDSIIADQLMIQGLLVALTDLQQTVRDYLVACNQNRTKINVSELILQLNHSDNSISAIVSSIIQFNDNDLKILNQLIIKDSNK